MAEVSTTWAGLDDNVRACVLLHLEPRDLANVPPRLQNPWQDIYISNIIY